MKAGPLRLAAFTVLALLALALGAGVLLGSFATLEVVERDEAPVALAVRDLYSADFAQVAALSREVRETLERAGIAPGAAVALYHPDALAGERPNEVGVAIAPGDLDRVAALPDAPTTRSLPQRRSMTVRFPRTGTLAYAVGYVRVESLLDVHRSARRYRRTPLFVTVEDEAILFSQPIEPTSVSAE